MIPTDLYIHVEVRQNGKWQPDQVDEAHYLEYPVWPARDDYDLFMFLAGVELEGIKQQYRLKVAPIDKPRGLPDTLNSVLEKLTRINGSHHSWLTLKEVIDGIAREEKRYLPKSVNLFPSFKEFIRDVKKDYPQNSDTDIRLVFWFD